MLAFEVVGQLFRYFKLPEALYLNNLLRSVAGLLSLGGASKHLGE